jgi:oxygen-dependent protoporphyrinogen oxidase
VSLDALLPRAREAERAHRSLLVAAARGRWARWRTGEPPPKLTSFATLGMQRLVDGLEKALGDRVRAGCQVTGLEREAAGRTAGERDAGGRWRLVLGDGRVLMARTVILAVPAHAASPLLGRWAPDAARLLDGVPYADIRVTALGYRRADLRAAPDGFGFLTCPGEAARVLGAVYSSTIFPDQAPPGRVLLRSFAGGTADPGFASLPEPEAVATVRRDLGRILGIRAEPEFTHDHIWLRAIPQYLLGHAGRMAAVLRAAAGLGGLHMAGSAYHGVAVNDCVRDARRVAGEVLAGAR